MANKLDSHYNDLAGIDSRTNQMFQNPRFARGGKNFAYRTDSANDDFDVLCKRRGNQHKASEEYGAEVGLIEYKFRDINTGEAKVEILGVARDGRLRRQYRERLKITRAGGSAASYSLYFNDATSLWRIEFLDSNHAVLGGLEFDETKTLSNFAADLASLGISGLSFDTVDESGSPVSSSLKAYLLDVTHRADLIDGDSTYNDVFSWELVVTPNSSGVLFDYVASGAWMSNSNFAGISFVNVNNSVYMTDGGWVIKYDGFAAYRAGMPRFPEASLSGWKVETSADAGLWDEGDHALRVQLRYRDPHGVVIYGKVQPLSTSAVNDGSGFITDGEFQFTVGTGGKKVTIGPRRIANDDRFPIWGCRLSADVSVPAGNSSAVVFSVASGHNVQVGMALRACVRINGLDAQTFYWEVTATTATSVTATAINKGFASVDFTAGQVFNACYVPSEFLGRQESSFLVGNEAINVFGPYYAIFATKANQTLGPYYELPGYYSVPRVASDEQDIKTDVTDMALVVPFDEDSEGGEELPRACRYLSKWQEQIVQGGRPYNPAIKDDYYPTIYSAAAQLDLGTTNELYRVKNTEALLCDFQSIFWADVLYPEGFPQSGEFQDSIDTEDQDEIRGMAPNKTSFFAFKRKATAVFSGTLADGDISKEILETDIGCASHLSIADVGGTLVWLDEAHGFCSGVAGRLPEVIGFPIQDKNKKNQFLAQARKLRWAGARAVNHRIDDIYLCYVPVGMNDKDNTTQVPYPGDDSITFVFDYAQIGPTQFRGAWYFWQEMNAAGGLLSVNDELWFSSFEDPASGDGLQKLWKMKKTGSIYDFSDHNQAIDFRFKSAWLNLGLYAIDKKSIQAVIASIRRGFRLLVSQYFNYVDSKDAEIEIEFQSGQTANPTLTVDLNKEKAKAISLGFENSRIHEDVSINGWDYQYSAEYDPGEAKR